MSADPANKPLDLRESRFVDEYFVDSNGTRAATAAGYSAKGARTQASRLLRRANIQAALQGKRETVAEKLDVTAERVIEGFARIAFADIRRVVQWGTEGFVRITPSDELTDEDAASISEIAEETRTIPQRSGEPIVIKTLKVKMESRIGGLTPLAKILGLLNERLTVNVVTQQVAQRVRELALAEGMDEQETAAAVAEAERMVTGTRS